MNTQLKKYFILLFVGLFMATGAQAQHASKILKSYKGEKETMMISIPGFVAKWAANVDGDKEVKQITKKIKKLKVFVSEEATSKTRTNMLNDFNRLFSKYDYKPLVQVKSDGDVVNIQFLPATKNKKGELVLLVNSDEEFVAVVIEGKFTEDDARQLAKNLNSNQFVN